MKPEPMSFLGNNALCKRWRNQQYKTWGSGYKPEPAEEAILIVQMRFHSLKELDIVLPITYYTGKLYINFIICPNGRIISHQ